MSGSAGGGDLILPQWLSDYWVWECKVRQRLPGLATAALTQAEAQCRGGRRPLAIYKQDRGPVLCSMWFPDFLQWADVVRQAANIVLQPSLTNAVEQMQWVIEHSAGVTGLSLDPAEVTPWAQVRDLYLPAWRAA